MVHVTIFLTRLLYLNNLVRNFADIQSEPYIPFASTAPRYHDEIHQQQLPQQPLADYHQQQQRQPPDHPVQTSQQEEQYNANQFQLQTRQQHQQSHYYHQSPYGTEGPTSVEMKPLAQQHQMTPQHHQHGTHHQHRLEHDWEWKEQVRRALLAYPSGPRRLMMMESLRCELVQKLAEQIKNSDDVLKRYSKSLRCKDFSSSKPRRNREYSDNEDDDDYSDDIDSDDPFLDADVEIVKKIQQEIYDYSGDEEDDNNIDRDANVVVDTSKNNTADKDAILEFSEKGANVVSPGSSPSAASKPTGLLDEDTNVVPTTQEVDDAHQLSLELRDYLPQLVSAVLHSEAPLTRNIKGLNPISRLRHLILNKCITDANWGIELCWLLEAEVGRAWKTLFEHRQQTGKRLIVVLPADKAQVLAQIGMEKRGAFNLLQDAEQATAYGYMLPSTHTDPMTGNIIVDDNGDDDGMGLSSLSVDAPRLPSSLSIRRCSHFGDTMHFIDRLTKHSLDCRRVPVIHRDAYLKDCLNEMNRRLRRRMVTRGALSLDVEDHKSPYDWPELADLEKHMLKYSIHFPMEPKCLLWPDGDDTKQEPTSDRTKTGAMRVLNILTEECRLLSSRERCPYLVHLEMAETGLEGNDARLYASGLTDEEQRLGNTAGATIEETLGMTSGPWSAAASSSKRSHYGGTGFQPYRIPSELLVRPIPHDSDDDFTAEANAVDGEYSSNNTRSPGGDVPRGGWDGSEGPYYPYGDDDVYQYYPPEGYDTANMNRQQSYQEEPEPPVMQQFSTETPPQYPTSQYMQTTNQPLISTGSALLDKVYGLPWSDKCKQIRQASPFGNVKGWRLASFIIKAGEDIRREALIMQIITKLQEYFKADLPESHRPHMRPYTMMCVGGDAGLVECLSDAKSIDEVKKSTDGFTTLRDYFERAYGPPTGASSHQKPSSRRKGIVSFETAQENFLHSLVGYSLVCYILQIKDRHNANILLDREGHIMHIDFGYVLGDTPKMAKVPIFTERAPFKLSSEFWDVIGGWDLQQGGLGVKFCKMFELAFECASKHSDEIVSIVESALLNITPNPAKARLLAQGVKQRLRMRGEKGSRDQKEFIKELVAAAQSSWETSTYDWLQKNMNGYI